MTEPGSESYDEEAIDEEAAAAAAAAAACARAQMCGSQMCGSIACATLVVPLGHHSSTSAASGSKRPTKPPRAVPGI